MKILLTGATGYIGKRLLLELIYHGHQLVCTVRDKKRFYAPASILKKIEVIEVDFLDFKSLKKIPQDIESAYYLMHSMSNTHDYKKLEKQSAIHFREVMKDKDLKHVIYLSGITNEDSLSAHLSSRRTVEHELGQGTYPLTTLRAGIIIGSGSASFEIIRDLVEKLPLMITPRWLNTKCQPIGVDNVLDCLVKSLGNKKTYDQNFDIGGPEIMTYKEILLGFAKARNLKRLIFTVPIMTPKLSSYWLYFVTSTSFKLASALVSSMKNEMVCRDLELLKIIKIKPIKYHDALKKTLSEIVENRIVSSWKDSRISSAFNVNISEFLQVPVFGCFQDKRIHQISNKQDCINRIWCIGGQRGWYYADLLWKLRGFIDKLFGGVGLRRGRTQEHILHVGDAIDFWRVLYSGKEEGRLLLFAEMKLPGEAWLEFKVLGNYLEQTATFRPKGVLGRLYWYAVSPFHGFIFKGMLNNLTR